MNIKNSFLKFIDLQPSMYSGSVVMNALGMQWYRILFFYLRRAIRISKTISSQYKPYLKMLERDGIVAIPNFFSNEDFAFVRQEYDKLSKDFKPDHHSAIPLPHVDRMNIHDKMVSPQVRDLFMKNQLISSMATAFLNRQYRLRFAAHITRIYCNQDELTLPQNGGTNNLHFDAPTRVLKAFYYLSDTDVKNAALNYCLSSHKRNSLRRLWLEYKLSIRYALNRSNTNHDGEYLDKEPWVKLTQEEMNSNGLKESAMAVKGNTLVLVDVGGFHRRGSFLAPGVRETIEISYRSIESARNSLYILRKLFT